MHKLVELPYAPDALEPVISAETISFHYGKHLQAYVDNLNKLLPGSEFEGLSLAQIVAKAPAGPIFNNAGQVLNHELYFTQFAPLGTAASVPSGPLAAAIDATWGSLDAFKADFEAKGAAIFGSGWVWLQADDSGHLSIGQYAGADNPAAHGLRPLLTFDVWEHAYYLDYQNRRPAYLHELWKILDWKVVEGRF